MNTTKGVKDNSQQAKKAKTIKTMGNVIGGWDLYVCCTFVSSLDL